MRAWIQEGLLGPSSAQVRTTGLGLILAALIVAGWLASLVALIGCELGAWPWWALAAVVVLRTLLQTGLFITAHDAMHGVLLPQAPAWNQRLGALTLTLYAGLAWAPCQRNHRRHHSHPASSLDPDFDAAPGSSALRWYARFMTGYLSGPQMARLLTAWAGLALLASLHAASGALNVLLLCTLPLLLSSLQLFVVGTYLPHRGQRAPLHRRAPASLDLPPWLSLLACFHFGYHREHHDHPGLAWFQLPAQRRRARRCSRSRRLAPA